MKKWVALIKIGLCDKVLTCWRVLSGQNKGGKEVIGKLKVKVVSHKKPTEIQQILIRFLTFISAAVFQKLQQCLRMESYAYSESGYAGTEVDFLKVPSRGLKSPVCS